MKEIYHYIFKNIFSTVCKSCGKIQKKSLQIKKKEIVTVTVSVVW